MKKIFLFAALMTATISLSSCNFDGVRTVIRGTSSKDYIKGSGKLVTKAQDFSATPFTALSLPSTLDAEFIPKAGAMRVEIITSDNTQQYARVKVSNGCLVVAWEETVNLDDDKAVVRIYAPSLDTFTLSGTADCDIKKGFTAGRLDIVNSGTGDLKAEGTVKAASLNLNNSGTGDCDFQSLLLRGNATMSNSGTGDNSIKKMQVAELLLQNSGTGDDEVLRLNGGTVKVTNSGTGDVTLSGKVQKVSVVASGTGDVDLRKLSANIVDQKNSSVGSILR